MAARETKAKERDSILDGAQREREKLLAEARAEAEALTGAAKKAAEEEVARIRRRLAESPLDGLRETGVDPKRLMEDALHADDPHYQRSKALEAQLAEERAARAKLEAKVDRWDKQEQEILTTREQEQRRAAIEAEEAKVLKLVSERADADEIRGLFGRRDRSFIAAAHDAAREYKDMFGVGPDAAQVVKYMALQALEERAKSTQGESAGKPSGNAPKVTAKQTTIGARDASVRRASEGDFSLLPPEKQREELAALADEILAKGA